jgi:enamine deaminase RidA (YjgF/YER057c/UK114 family)
MSEIQRLGVTKRWSEIAIHGGVAYWVEVADDPTLDVRGQITQVLQQIDATLVRIGSDRSRLILIQIYLANLADARVLNELWDAWTPAGHAPVRACVQAGLSKGYHVEMVITAAADGEP